jgi:Flp pilus assembly protein TadG
MIARADLARDTCGVSTVEFALVAPVMLMTLFGLFDLGHGMYTKALLEGVIEKAARNSTIEGATTGALDTRVANSVRQIAPGATLSFSRQSYSNFSTVRQPEDWTDVDSDGSCDNGEAFEDINGNGTWDADRGRAGNGGARDAVLYKVTVTYKRIMPIGRLIGQSPNTTMTGVAVLRNQPFGLQGTTVTTGNCP